MLKALIRGRNPDKKLVLLGLSEENVKRLREGKSIFFSGAVLGLEGLDFSIIYAPTEEQMVEQLKAQGIDVPKP